MTDVGEDHGLQGEIETVDAEDLEAQTGTEDEEIDLQIEVNIEGVQCF